MLKANCRIPTSRPHWYLRNWRAHWCHWVRWWDSVLDGALNKIVCVEADWWVELFVNNLKSELITVSMTVKLLSNRRVSGWVLNGLVTQRTMTSSSERKQNKSSMPTFGPLEASSGPTTRCKTLSATFCFIMISEKSWVGGPRIWGFGWCRK